MCIHTDVWPIRPKYKVNIGMNRRLVTIIGALALVLAMVAPYMGAILPALAFTNGLTPASADYVVLEGTRHTDYYDARQYSYKIYRWWGLNPENAYAAPLFDTGSLRLGLTEYGEFVTYDAITGESAGIAYGDPSTWALTESWANTAISPKYWVQGWLLAINYTRVGEPLTILAYAYFSDMSTTEGGRGVFTKPAGVAWNSGPVYPGTLIPSGVKILFEDARLVVARTSVIVHDGYYNEDVAKVIITVLFNKVKKYAITFYDVKILLDPKVLDYITEFVFTKRYEIDLARGINLDNDAYVHYYHNISESIYNHPIIGDSVPGDNTADGWNKFDLLVAYNDMDESTETARYIFFDAVWPNATEYTVYTDELTVNLALNRDGILDYGTMVPDVPGLPSGPGEPTTPWVEIQWRLNSTSFPDELNWLSKSEFRQIRFVNVIGMTEDVYELPFAVEDYNETMGANFPGFEVWYLVNEVFNPDDMYQNMYAGTPIDVSLACDYVSPQLGNVDYWTNPMIDYAYCPIENGEVEMMWYSVGEAAHSIDSAAVGMLSEALSAVDARAGGTWNGGLMALFDKDTMIPPGSSVPFGLFPFTGTYLDSMGRTRLMDFAFGLYDDDFYGPPQPIAGGYSYYGSFWYPSISPLAERMAGGVLSPYAFYGFGPTLQNVSVMGIVNSGGPKANWLTRYFNDFAFAIFREGDAGSYSALVDGGTITGTAPTSDPTKLSLDIFPLSTYNVGVDTFNIGPDHFIVTLTRDENGTIAFNVWGWNGRDTFWGSVWASYWLIYVQNYYGQVVPDGTVAIIVHISYNDLMEPSAFHVVFMLGTITELTGFNTAITMMPGEVDPWFVEKLTTYDWTQIHWDP